MRSDISFHISPNSGVPIYRQIIDQVERLIATDQSSKGLVVPTVNEAARQLAVNPTAISRAYRILLDQGTLVRGNDEQLQIAGPAVTENDLIHDPYQPGPAYRGDDPYIFVSYAHADKTVVYAELARLSGEGFNIWYDEGISPGSSWDEEVARALSNCTLFLYFITPNSVKSQNCSNEVNFCLSKERRILCVYLEQTQLPAGLELNLSANQAIVRHNLSDSVYQKKLSETLLDAFPWVAQKSAEQNGVQKPPGEPGTLRSVAVLPFVNNTTDSANEYLCDGLAGDLITALSSLENIRVASQIDSFAFKSKDTSGQQIGQALKIDNILSGSIQVSGTRIRVNVSLDRVRDATNLWSKRYEGNLDDIFGLQDEIADRVADALSSPDALK